MFPRFRYRNFPKINEFYLRRGRWTRIAHEIQKRAVGLHVDIDAYYFSGHNPLRGPEINIKWIVERYAPAFDYLDRRPAKSVLEIGCAFGLSPWLMSDMAKEVVGMDMHPGAVAAATKLFPEVRYVCADWQTYFRENPDAHFDVILNCYGPIDVEDPAHLALVMKHCNRLINIGYRASSWRQMLTQCHKLPGYQLSYYASVHGDPQKRGISWRYPLYYFRKEYVRVLLHAWNNGYFLPI